MWGRNNPRIKGSEIKGAGSEDEDHGGGSEGAVSEDEECWKKEWGSEGAVSVDDDITSGYDLRKPRCQNEAWPI